MVRIKMIKDSFYCKLKGECNEYICKRKGVKNTF